MNYNVILVIKEGSASHVELNTRTEQSRDGYTVEDALAGFF